MVYNIDTTARQKLFDISLFAKGVIFMKKTLALLLAVILTAGVCMLTACDGFSSIGNPEADGHGSIVCYPSTSAPEYIELYKDCYFDNYTFVFASVYDENTVASEIYREDDSASLVSKAMEERKKIIKEMYSANIAEENIAASILPSEFATEQLSRYDFIVHESYGQKGYSSNYVNLHSLDIYLPNPWWDQGYVKENTVDGILYEITGSFSTQSFGLTHALIFNKSVKNSIPDIQDMDFYSLVENGYWTIDTFLSIVNKASSVEHGTEGLALSPNSLRQFYFGMGKRYLEKTDKKDGTSEFSAGFDKNDTAASQLLCELVQAAGNSSSYSTAFEKFNRNELLFTEATLVLLEDYIDADFGILPFPKMSTEQKNHISFAERGILTLSVPRTCRDLAMISDFLTIYAYYSHHTVYEAYVESICALTSDAKDAKTVKTLLSGRTYDLAFSYNFAEADGCFLACAKNGGNTAEMLGGKISEDILAAAADHAAFIKNTENKHESERLD
jgi:hypothetical protein